MALATLSFESALDDLARLAVAMQLMQFGAADAAADFSSLAEDDAQQLQILASMCSRPYVQMLYQITTRARADLRLAPDPAHGFLMAMLRLLTVHPGHGTVSTPMPLSPNAREVGAVTGTESAAPASTVSEPMPAPVTEVAPVVQPVSSPAVSALRNAFRPMDWPQLVDQLGLKGMTRELAQHSACQSLADGLLVLNLPATHRQLLMPASEQRLAQAISENMGTLIRVRFDIVEQVGVTAAVLRKEAAEEKMNNAVAAIESDPIVQELIDVFDAKLIDGSIRPLAS
jgi:DNA polymerase-3 subunit gamma/tau